MTFLLTYQTFMTSEELLAKLIHRYQSPIIPEDPLSSYKLFSYKIQSSNDSQNIIKLRVLNIVKKWLSNHVDNFIGHDTTDIVHGMRAFIEKEPMNDFLREGTNIQRLIHLKLAQREEKIYSIDYFQDSPPSYSSFHDDAFDIFKYPTLEVARQLTLIDYYYYFRKIQV